MESWSNVRNDPSMIPRALPLVALLALAACERPEPGKAPEAPAPTQESAQAPSTAPAGDPAAAAFEARYTPTYNSCLNSGEAAAGVTAAMAECIAAELKVQDDKLNFQYAAAMHRLPADEGVKLRDVQRQWIKDRDAKCRAAANSGGTIDRLNGPSCLLDETILRTMDLERLG